LVGRYPIFDERRHAMGEDGGLSGAGTSEDQEGSVA
jgi:hypothetical protein